MEMIFVQNFWITFFWKHSHASEACNYLESWQAERYVRKKISSEKFF
jgi:hypothetical protein